MEGMSPRGRPALRVERGWKANRLAGQFQADAYRLAVPERTAAFKPRCIGGAAAVEPRGTGTLGRAAAGGRS